MNYAEFIQSILDTRGRFNCGDEYHERHHIIAKCLGGGDETENLIDLFAREHFEAHRLLALENPDNEKLVFAWWAMSTMKSQYTEERYQVSATEYEEAKIAYSMMLSNMFSGTGNPFYGKEHKDDIKEMLSEMHSIPVIQLDLNGRFVAEYKNAKEASQATGADYSSILKCCADKNHCNSAGGYLWIYKIDYQNGKEKMYQNNHLRPVVQLNKNGDFIAEYTSIADASECTNICATTIHMCCKGVYYSAGGFIWLYKENYDPSIRIVYHDNRLRAVVQIDKQGNIINTYKSTREAYIQTGVHTSDITSCCQYKRHMAGGYVWRYADEEYDIKEIINKKYRQKQQGGQVLQFDENMNLIAIHESVADAVKNTGVSKSSISRCCRGEQTMAGGYKWMRKSDWNKLQSTI